VAKALRRLGVEVSSAGISDLSVPAGAGEEQARKVAGTAQLRKRHAVLVHGALLLTADVSLFSRYLRMPSDQPAYRAGRGHADFCQSVADCLKLDASEKEALPGRFAETLAAILDQDDWNRLSPPDDLPPESFDLLRGKYLSDDWNRRRKRTAEPRCGLFRRGGQTAAPRP
jgi:lipoate-protein ligase A